MLATPTLRRQARILRWRESPWYDLHPDWLRIDRDLPASHRARLIARVVDSLDLLAHLPDFYAGFGSSSWHPALLLKLILYELDRGTLSPTTWCTDCRELDPVKWLLHGARPSRAALYEARNRFSPELLERLNQQVLQEARADGVCPANRASLDGTFVAAKGSRHRLINLSRLDKRLVLLEQVIAADETIATDCGGGTPLGRPKWMSCSPQGRKNQRKRYEAIRQRLLVKQEQRRQRRTHRAKAKRRSPEQVVICVAEPEAAVGLDKFKVFRPLYNVQLMRDLDSPFLLGYGVFPTVTDAGLLPEMLKRTKRLTGKMPKAVLADGIYNSVADLLVCQQEEVTLYAPVKVAATVAIAAEPKQKEGVGEPVVVAATAAVGTVPEPRRQPLPMAEEKVKRYYGKERFIWDARDRSYTCPAGKRMQKVESSREKRGNGEEVSVERYATKECRGCEKRGECTGSKEGRRIKRMADEPLVEAMRERMASEGGKELYKKRKETIEREFADMKEHRGLERFSGHGDKHAEKQVGLLVLLANGKNLHRLRQVATRAA